MKKIIALLAVLVLVLSLAGCAEKPHRREKRETTEGEIETISREEEEFLEAISGEWSTDGEVVDIRGYDVEITGYYECEGQYVPGVITPGTITYEGDGKFTIHIEDYTWEGRLEDGDRLFLNDTQYYR